MGLIRAAKGAAGGVFGDQWKEYFYCESMSSDTLVSKARKKTSRRSSNRHGSENVISNGSVIAVNDGQCMIIVEQGKVVDVCAEPGEYVYDSFTEPSLFCSDLEDGIVQVFDQIGKRFGFGGETPEDQRVYFINTKELTGNKYGTPGPVPFRVIDANLGLDIDISVRCFGEYSYRIANPILFYTNVCGNVESEFTREELDGQLRSELMTALQPAFARISAMGIRYSELPGHTMELSDALNQILSEKWEKLRGIRIVSLGVSSIKASEEDEAMLKELQKNAVFRNPTMAAAHMVGAQASAMQAAASNQNAGPAMAFAGMNMASNAGGVNPSELFAMARNDPSQRSAQQEVQSPVQQDSWVCSCGNVNKGKFCSECGNPRPSGPWVCSCGTANKGKFCSECGRPRP
ncbi:SPFH domain-containing protein [Blautia caecimuris]|uniref:SPFH domain-containing protein n=1 Tax=Blautia caecimuris TaxID=1796615 RepID=UPI0034AC8560